MKIKKAIVAVAGSGTRFLPATKAMPKEMLPIVDKPIIQLVVEELVEAGIEDIILVTKWDKKPLEDHFDHNWALANELKMAGKTQIWEEVKKISELANFIYIRQKGPYGNGAPILSAASLVKDEPFVFCYGDDLVKSEISFTKQLVDDFAEHGCPVIGVQEVPMDQVYRYGVMRLKGRPRSVMKVKEETRQLEEIIEKPTVELAPSNLVNFGRMILNQEYIDILKETPIGKGNELWTNDAINTYIKRGGVFYTKKIENGEWLTTGDPLNYLKAVLCYALERPEIADELMGYIEKLRQDHKC
ncbi:MAG: UTP--glucose-1-phosphate uridylyltransferase [bacterium]